MLNTDKRRSCFVSLLSPAHYSLFIPWASRFMIEEQDSGSRVCPMDVRLSGQMWKTTQSLISSPLLRFHLEIGAICHHCHSDCISVMVEKTPIPNCIFFCRRLRLCLVLQEEERERGRGCSLFCLSSSLQCAASLPTTQNNDIAALINITAAYFVLLCKHF